jgi:hypothetical protein
LEEKSRGGIKFSAVVAELEKRDGLFVRNLKEGDVVVIETNHVYEFLFLDSEGNAIVTSNGFYITEPTETQVLGATFGGSTIKIGWILLGCRLEIKRHLEMRPLCISRVRAIYPIYLKQKKSMSPEEKVH